MVANKSRESLCLSHPELVHLDATNRTKKTNRSNYSESNPSPTKSSHFSRITCFPIVSVPAGRKWSSQGSSVQGRKPVPPSSEPYRCTVSPGQHNHQSILSARQRRSGMECLSLKFGLDERCSRGRSTVVDGATKHWLDRPNLKRNFAGVAIN